MSADSSLCPWSPHSLTGGETSATEDSEAGGIIDALTREVRRRFESAPGCHDWDHTHRVLRNARKIASMEIERGAEPDLLIIDVAALLHDVARVEELAANGTVCHAALGAKLAPEILRECGFDDERVAAKIAECVRRHRWRRNSTARPETLEQKIIFDADKLDSIGAIGVARAVHFSGRIGSRLHNTAEEALASEAYGEGDSAYREYLVKLRHIPRKMLTNSGKELAVERAEFMRLFFDTLNAECFATG